MLSESERRTLDEIEHRLAVEEPALASALVEGRPLNTATHYALAGVFGVLGVLLLVLGVVGPALASIGFGSILMLLRGYTWR